MPFSDHLKKIACDKAYYIARRVERCEYQRAYNAAHPGQKAARDHANGKSRPLAEAKDSAPYLGVYIAERALSRYFDHITRMPVNNPGYDFLCGRGYKIDVKSACLRYLSNPSPHWNIGINKNDAADYFLVLLFDNREDLNPMHVLLIPGKDVCHKSDICITNTPKHFAKWKKYERPIDRVVACCDTIRSGART